MSQTCKASLRRKIARKSPNQADSRAYEKLDTHLHAEFGKLWRSHNAKFTRPFLTLTRAAAKVRDAETTILIKCCVLEGFGRGRGNLRKICPKAHRLAGRFGYFLFFFCSGAGEKEEASEDVARGSVLIKNRGRGGFSKEDAWEGEGRRGNVSGEGGGGLNIFSRARNSHQAHRVLQGAPPRGRELYFTFAFLEGLLGKTPSQAK